MDIYFNKCVLELCVASLLKKKNESMIFIFLLVILSLDLFQIVEASVYIVSDFKILILPLHIPVTPSTFCTLLGDNS